MFVAGTLKAQNTGYSCRSTNDVTTVAAGRDRREYGIICFEMKIMMAQMMGLALLMTGLVSAAVEVSDWEAQERLPEARAFAFGGFLPDGRMVMAGGRGADGQATDDIFVRSSNVWSRVGKLPWMARGVSAATPKGLVCIGRRPDAGVGGGKETPVVFLLGADLRAQTLPNLPSDGRTGFAVAEGSTVYASADNRLWRLDLDRPDAGWETFPSIPGPSDRTCPVAAVLNGGRGRFLAVFGGSAEGPGHKPKALEDAWGLTLDRTGKNARREWFKLASPTGFSSVGAALVRVGPAEALLLGGFGTEVWNRTAGMTPVPESGPRTVLAYDARANAWRVCGEFTSDDAPRCAAVADARRLGAAGERETVLAGGACAGRPSTTVSVLRVTGVAETAVDGRTAGDIRRLIVLNMVAVLFVVALSLWQVRRKNS